MKFDAGRINLNVHMLEHYKAKLRMEVMMEFDPTTPPEIKEEMGLLAAVLQKHLQDALDLKVRDYGFGYGYKKVKDEQIGKKITGETVTLREW